MVHLKSAERKLDPAPVAPTLLLAKEDVIVLAVWHRRVDVGAFRKPNGRFI